MNAFMKTSCCLLSENDIKELIPVMSDGEKMEPVIISNRRFRDETI